MNKNAAVLMVLLGCCGTTQAKQNFALPASKGHVVQCQREALQLHPGKITDEQTLHTNAGGIEIRFEIHDRDENDWVVFCNAADGKVLKHYELEID